MASKTLDELVEELSVRYPDDAEDLEDALAQLRKQKLSSVGRLAKLNDGQWQRLGLPMGIEAILREEVELLMQQEQSSAAPAACHASAPAPAVEMPPAIQRQPELQQPQHKKQETPAPQQARVDEYGELALEPFDYDGVGEHYEPDLHEGLHRRRGGSGGSSSSRSGVASAGGGSRGSGRGSSSEKKTLLTPMELTPPPELDLLWQQLLDDTLPPDKRNALQESWEGTPDVHDRYMMFLEYSSYLRKPEVSEEEKAERKKQLEPLMRELGLNTDYDEPGQVGAFIWWIFLGILFFIAGLVYYFYTRSDPLQELHDLHSL